VPRLTVVVRKAYGGAFITMNSKDLGADVVFAWPQAEIGVMGAAHAVELVYRRELALAVDRGTAAEALIRRYEATHIAAAAAAREGVVDEVIEPDDTRASLSWALDLTDQGVGVR
jgi:acetyl-CoA carboxylase carboxyltransferase component